MNTMICYKLINVTKDGITIKAGKNNVYIRFDDCVKNFSAEKGEKNCKCVATRDITTLTFTFYTHPKINVMFRRCSLKDLLVRRSAVNRFLEMQKAIVQAGYTSYDLS